MAYNRQKITDVSMQVRANGNCYQFARGKLNCGSRPNHIQPPYTCDNMIQALQQAGGVHITTSVEFTQYEQAEEQYFLIAAMLGGSQEFHFMRMGLTDNGQDGWIGKWSQVGNTYTKDYSGPTAASSFASVNAQLLLKEHNGSYSSVGYFVFQV